MQRLHFDLCRVLDRQSSLGVLALLPQASDGFVVAGGVRARVLFLEGSDTVVHQTLVKVLTTQMSVSCSGFHFEDPIVNSQESHIEGAATQIEHQDVLLFGLTTI
mmetsp:Transcript_11403/g.15683  ORF Transcript_11403/g.15683 Transcript_11403/m.15683 type:complete len:105 (-) Transcript_11403:873-1187(-)